MDTTFNIAEYYFMQTVYRHLAVLKRRDDEHSWFPGPTMTQKEKSTSDFSYFWQAYKRGNGAQANLRCLGTDEDEALIQGIYGKTNGNIINLLSKEHVCKNIMKKLLQLNFPARQAKFIVDDTGNSFPGNRTADSKDRLV